MVTYPPTNASLSPQELRLRPNRAKNRKTLPAPGGAPDYNPFPGGDPTKPSPAKAFEQVHGNDGIHLNAEGYRQIIRNALQQGMGAMLEATPRKRPEAKPPRLASE